MICHVKNYTTRRVVVYDVSQICIFINTMYYRLHNTIRLNFIFKVSHYLLKINCLINLTLNLLTLLALTINYS